MSISKFAFFLAVLLVFTSHSFVAATLAASSQDNAASALKNAEESVAAVYQTVLNLEELGGNVSDSLSQLNEAGGFLAEAHVAFRLGSFDDAIRLANLCYDTSNSIKERTEKSLVQAAGGQSAEAFIRIAGSILGIAVVGFCSFWAWRVLVRRYHRQILRMKPEVGSNEP